PQPRPPADAGRPAQPLPVPAGRSRRRGARRRPLRRRHARVGARRLRAGAADFARSGGVLSAAPKAMTAAPSVGPLPSVAPPTAERMTLSTGLEVVTVRREVAPIVSAALMIRSGAGDDPPEQSGLASLTAEMLDEGAGARDALALADELERLGADLWLGSGRDGSQLSVQAPSATFFEALAIAGDVLCRPRLTDGDWQRVLADRKTSNAQRRDQPEAVVSVVSDRLLFGAAHPYGRPVEGFAH